MAASPSEAAAAISPDLQRPPSETLIAEVLPLLDACRFLERNAERILRTRELGRKGRPLWLSGVHAQVTRSPFGHILVIGPANFPLLLPGVQVLQALAAGNRVTWKPGRGGHAVAAWVAQCLAEAGLPEGLLTVTDDTVEASTQALNAAPDKVIFTGSGANGKQILARLAAAATPAVVELSGCDAVVVLPSADLRRTALAVAYGLRLNGAAVCMSPRRLFATQQTRDQLLPLLQQELSTNPPVVLSATIANSLRTLLDEAEASGASVNGDWQPGAQRPLLVLNALPTLSIARADIFAPVLSVITAASVNAIPELYAACPYALTVAIFGREEEALALAADLRAGSVLINDLIVPTADPRVPFGGRAASGYGVTRGEEGLLEMTAPKTLLVRRGRSERHWLPVTTAHQPLFEGMIRASHGKSWLDQLKGARQVLRASRTLDH